MAEKPEFVSERDEEVYHTATDSGFVRWVADGIISGGIATHQGISERLIEISGRLKQQEVT